MPNFKDIKAWQKADDLDEGIHFLPRFPHFKERGGGESDPGTWTKKGLHIGTDTIYLALETAAPNASRHQKRYHDPGINHVGFVVDDIDTVITRLKEAGYKEGISVDPPPYRKLDIC